MGNHEHAIKDFMFAIKKEPEYALSHFHMGMSKLKSRMIREAIVDFERSNSLKENPSVYDGLGCCKHALRDFDEAILNFNLAIEAKENNVDFLTHRAQCYFDM